MTDPFLNAAVTPEPKDYGVLTTSIQAAMTMLADINEAIGLDSFIDASREKHARQLADYTRHHQARDENPLYLVPRDARTYPEISDYGRLKAAVKMTGWDWPTDKNFFGAEPHMPRDNPESPLVCITVLQSPDTSRYNPFSLSMEIEPGENGAALAVFKYTPQNEAAFGGKYVSRAYNLNMPAEIAEIKTALGRFWQKAAGGVGENMDTEKPIAFFNYPNPAFDTLLNAISFQENTPARPRLRANGHGPAL